MKFQIGQFYFIKKILADLFYFQIGQNLKVEICERGKKFD
jgi:hypothetical protein